MRRVINLLLAVVLILAVFGASGCRVAEVERYDPLQGELAGMGVSAPVSVVRDQNGIVHIAAQSDEDLFFALGYSLAQDRFGQLDIWRRAGGGRLAELLGSPVKYKGISVAGVDIAARTLLFAESANKGVAELDPESRALLAAYVNGINRYLKDGGETIALHKTMKIEPEPWTMEDCFVVAGLFGLAMTYDALMKEYYLERLRQDYGEEIRDFFTPQNPEDTVIITQDKELLSSVLPLFFPGPMEGIGSNNWALAGSRTVSGLPLLCNDPHVPNSMTPTFWYHCHLKSPSYDVMGLMFAGFPCFGAAVNGRLGWTLTNVGMDYIDLWREKLNPDNPDEYLDNGKWVPFEKQSGVVKVKGKKSVSYTMRRSRHGVVVDKKLLGWNVPTAPGEVLVIRYVDMDLARFFRGYQTMARAGNFEEWLAGAKDMAWGPFAWNHTYADVEGNIAYWTTGHIPRRADNQGYIVRQGWAPESEWQGFVPFEENPHLVNPQKGYIVTANNRVEVPGYPYYITDSYSSPSRAYIISEQIESKEKHSAMDMQRIQYNVSVYSARKWVPMLLEDLEAAQDPMLREAREILQEWQSQGYPAHTSSRGTCVYEVFKAKFTSAVFKDELKKHMGRLGISGLLDAGLMKIIDDPDNEWFDDKDTRERETRGDIVRRVMKESMQYLRKQLGRESGNWSWGELSTLTLSPSFVAIPGFTKKVSLGPYPLPGTSETVFPGDQLFVGPLGFMGFAGPSSRFIVDFANPRRAWFNCTAGMAEFIEGGRYDNIMSAWLDGRYLVMSMEEQEYRQGMMGELILRP